MASIIVNTLCGCLPGPFKAPVSPLKLLYPVSWIIEGIGMIFQGALELTTSPLNYLFRMPFRSLLTCWKGDKKYYAGSNDEEGPSDLELRKLAGSGGKLAKGKAAQLRAQ